MNKYIYQKFLLNCEYEDVNILGYPTTSRNLMEVPDLGEDYCMFDVGKDIARKISLTTMDETIDTKEDWMEFQQKVENIDILVITEAGKTYANPIIQSYRLATLKAYLYRLSNLSVKVELAK